MDTPTDPPPDTAPRARSWRPKNPLAWLRARQGEAAAPRPHWITVLIGLVSPILGLVALAVSFGGYKISNRSYELSRQSLEMSQRSVRIGQRAYLAVSQGRFWTNAALPSKDDPIMIGVHPISYNVSNLGNTPAHGLKVTFTFVGPPEWKLLDDAPRNQIVRDNIGDQLLGRQSLWRST